MALKFSDLLKIKREEKKLTQKEVAKLMGITPMYYARFENNNLLPTRRNIQHFLKFLEIDEIELTEIIKIEIK